ncbi:MAG TPA: hypothetical protein LFW21_01465, partial [Rickettsia endosymbiont of Pyrocoelia pectoralis]|nr:hypothetical protein [Rickettsia endosymbiont of Pyrocoelia pectoralis]
RNSFYSHEERNEFIRNFVNSYNNTRLRCLQYFAPLDFLNGNLKKYNMCGWIPNHHKLRERKRVQQSSKS